MIITVLIQSDDGTKQGVATAQADIDAFDSRPEQLVMLLRHASMGATTSYGLTLKDLNNLFATDERDIDGDIDFE